MKKVLTYLIITIVVGTIIFLIINNFVGREETNSNSNKQSNENSNVQETTKDTVSIDYKMYQELRSEVHEEETFAILIMNSNNEIDDNFKKEVIYSFNDRKAIIYEIDTSELSDVEFSSLVNDITDIMKYSKPSIVTPTLIVSKKGKIVYTQEGLKYSVELIEDLDKKEIE